MRFSISNTVSLLAVAAPALVSASPLARRQPSANDILVFQFAEILEQLETEFYSQALTVFQQTDFVTAGFTSSEIAIQQIDVIAIDEMTHASVIETELVNLGSQAVSGCQFEFSSAMSSVSVFLETARIIENLGVGAYLGAAHLLDDPVLLTAAASIVTIESRHQTILNLFSGVGSAIPSSFDIALTPQEVLAVASEFITGCSLSGITANPTLTITNTEVVTIGSLITFESVAITSSSSGLFCQMLVGGSSFSITLAIEQCVVPTGINGPVAIFITSDSQPLLNNVVDRATVDIVAGPVMAFIDTAPEMLGMVALSGAPSVQAIASTSVTTITLAQASQLASAAAAGIAL